VIDQLFEHIGGSPAVTELVTRFYDRVLADPHLAPFFPKTDMAALQAKQVMFISMLVGGERRYVGRDLTTTHAAARAQGLNDRHFDLVLEHFEAALNDMAVDPAFVRELLTRLETTRSAVLGDRTAGGI
jgi:hemoglobin